MTLRGALASAALAVTCVAAQDSAPPGTERETVTTIKGADVELVRSMRVVGDRIAGIVRSARAPSLVPLRADEATRAAEALVRAQRALAPASAAPRGRAWSDLGFGSGTEPQELVAAIELDVPGMTFDAARSRLLVDPERLRPDVGRGNPEEDADASVLLTTGVTPDEPVAGHYVAHALLDSPGLPGPVTTDALLARSALAEGSANLAALVFLFGGVGLESEVVSGALRPDDALGGRLVPEAMRSGSPVLASLLEFVYLDGFAQASALARKGGFSRLTQERKHRLTTRDVLHLDRTPAPSVALLPPSLPVTLALSPVDRDSLGEQGIVTWVSILTGKDNLGLIAGDGWQADVLWRFEPRAGTATQAGDGVTIWVTQWTTDQDANDFAYAVERCLNARFPSESLEDDLQRGGRVLRRADRIYRLLRTGKQAVLSVVPPRIDSKMGPAPKKKGSSPPRPPVRKLK